MNYSVSLTVAFHLASNSFLSFGSTAVEFLRIVRITVGSNVDMVEDEVFIICLSGISSQVFDLYYIIARFRL